MNSLFTAKNVLIQGITGKHGSFQTKAMISAGTNVVAGTTPGKGGESVEGVPVYNSIIEAQQQHTIETTVIFVPAAYAKGAILEAIDALIPFIVCVTEGIPIHDMLVIKKRLVGSTSVLLGPNSPGLLIPGSNKLGIIPAALSLAGSAAIVSRSGTLTYEAMAGLTSRSIGQRYVIGIGGDQIHGIGYRECLEVFQNDPAVNRIILIGEIGGTEELDALEYIKTSVTKPVFVYITGHYAPAGIQLGHAGAILGSDQESASAKTALFDQSNIMTATSITRLVELVAESIN